MQFYQMGHEDRCHDNTFVQGGPRLTPHLPGSGGAWADLRGCVASNTNTSCAMAQNPYGGGAAPIMVVQNNTVYVHTYLLCRQVYLHFVLYTCRQPMHCDYTCSAQRTRTQRVAYRNMATRVKYKV